MKFELSCPGKFIDELDSAARASGVSRQKFARAVLGAAVSAVREQEELRAFQEYVEARGQRARPISAAVKSTPRESEEPPDNSEGSCLRRRDGGVV